MINNELLVLHEAFLLSIPDVFFQGCPNVFGEIGKCYKKKDGTCKITESIYANDLRTIIEAKDRIIRLQDDKIFQLENELKENIKKADLIKSKNRGKKEYA